MTAKLQAKFDDYANFHKTRGNKITHYLGIPMIVVSLLGLLSHLIIADWINGAVILMAIAVAFYLWLDWKIAIACGSFIIGLYFLSQTLTTPVLWILFVLGWILQFVGHGVYEKKSPAFLTNLAHVLVGPLWVFCNLVGYA